MDVAAKKEILEGNFQQALTIINGILESTENNRSACETFELLLGKAQVLILLARYKDSVDYYRSALAISELSESHVFQFVDCLVKSVASVPRSKKQAHCLILGKVICQICTGIIIDPVTLQCGHTLCTGCIINKRCSACKVCNKPIGINHKLVMVNITLQRIISKCFPNQVEACGLRLQGNAFLKNGKTDLALEKYFEACKFDPNDPLINSNVAHIMIQNGQFKHGLEHANIACKVRPEWPKGFYRRGCALIGLHKRSEAVHSLLQCLAKDPINSVVHKLATEVIQNLFDEHSSADNESVDRVAWITEMMELFEQTKESQEKTVQESEESSKKEVKSNVTKCDAQDFECTLCCRLFYEPVTTPCGHTFCRSCLNRSLDHRPDCPVCRSSLSQVLASRNQNITDAIEKLMQTYLADEYEKRKQIHLEEMEKLASVASNTEDDIPIFVCTMAFPLMPCPLHIFEPRYRLMVRQCMESGSRQFGMCAYDEENEYQFAQYGTMLEILDVQFLPDGRSLVNTIGGRRFKVLSQGKRDGYSVAKVEWIVDVPVSKEEEDELKDLIKDVFDAATNWFNMLPVLLRRRIANSVIEMPRWQEDAVKMPHGPEWLWWLITVCPMDPRSQLSMLGMKSLKGRLLKMRRILAAMS